MATILPVSSSLVNVSGGLAEAPSRPAPLPAQQTAAPTVEVSRQAVQPVAKSDELESAVEKISKAVSAFTSELSFSVDQDLGVSVVKVIDKQSNEVIRQIPSEDVLNIAKGLDKVLGVLFEQQV
jgi:flagellar protein FlaG